MAKTFRLLGKIIAFFLAALIVITLPMAWLAFDFGQVFFSPAQMKRVFEAQVIRTDLVSLGLARYSEEFARQLSVDEATPSGGDSEVVQLISLINLDDWKKIRAEVLPDEILSGWSALSVDRLYAWLDSPGQGPRIVWDLAPFKARINSEHGVNTILIAFDNLKPCSPAEIADYQARLSAASPGSLVGFNLCKFPAPWYGDQFNGYVDSLGNLINSIPDDLILIDASPAALIDLQNVDLAKTKANLRLVRLAARYGWLIPVGLLALVIIFAVRSWKSLGLWWGIPLLLGGILALLTALTNSSYLPSLVERTLVSQLPGEFLSLANQVIVSLAAIIFRPLLIQGCVTAVSGLLLIGLAILLGRSAAKVEAE